MFTKQYLDWDKVVWNIKPDRLECVTLLQQPEALLVLDKRGTRLGHIKGHYYDDRNYHKEIYGAY